MEFFSALTLEAFLKEKIACISIEQKILICKNMIETVMYLHSQKIAHKDLNLLNILIDPASFQIKLIDFGLSTFDVLGDCSPEGNFSYRPPENIEIFQNPYSADLWCLNLILLSVFLEKKISTKKAMNLAKKTDLKEIFSNNIFLFYVYCNLNLLIQEKIPDMKELQRLD